MSFTAMAKKIFQHLAKIRNLVRLKNKDSIRKMFLKMILLTLKQYFDTQPLQSSLSILDFSSDK